MQLPATWTTHCAHTTSQMVPRGTKRSADGARVQATKVAEDPKAGVAKVTKAGPKGGRSMPKRRPTKK